MASTNLENLTDAATGFNQLPVSKKVSILFSIFLTIVMAGLVVNWSREPALVPLYANLDSKETSKVIDALSKSDIIYRFDSSSGNVLVPVGQIHEVRMKLAGLGLPKGAGTGFELLDKPASFGTSQFMENVNYRRALEGELSRTIGSLDGVRAARVHLGLPKQSSFLRKNVISSASVFVDLYGGHTLDSNQVAGIMHLVSASVSGLTRDNVSVIDQRGNLLNTKSGSNKIVQAQEETNLIKAKEQDLTRKIKELLSPIYGPNAVLAEVTLDMDFTYVEETKENFDNSRPSVRSESLSTEQKTTEEYPEGVPGSLSNQPPSAGGAPETVEGEDQAVAPGEEAPPPAPKPKVYRDEAKRNYELDRSISKEVRTTNKIAKQSISVVINDKVSYAEDGTEQYSPLNEEEIAKVERIVKDAVGFNADRGDTISVVNSSFSKAPPMVGGESSVGSMEFMNILTQTWVLSAIKQSLGALFILLVIFMVIKPTIRSLADFKPPPPPPPPPEEEKEEVKLALPEPDKGAELRLEHVQQITKDDSKKAAQVVMNWLGSEED